ncbi:VRR-NUC domain-containing protein [Bacillus thuringiensis]|uniref:VRR-NUC domain-containing protein n=1 Tax=Bacillus thuringiensis TaxID=1428 RepID=UPI0033365ACF
MKEIDVQNSIRIALNPHAIVFRANVGTFRTTDGRMVATGLPKGFSDLFGFRKSDGKMFFIEVKNEKGRLRVDQKHFIETMRDKGAIAGVVRSVEEAIQLITVDER